MYEGTKHSTLTEDRRRGLPLDQLQKAAGHGDLRRAGPGTSHTSAQVGAQAALEPELISDTVTCREISFLDQFWKHSKIDLVSI